MGQHAWNTNKARLSSAVVLDVLDKLGRMQQAPNVSMPLRTAGETLVGVAKTTLWMDFAHDDPATYSLELKAVDTVRKGEVIVCATANSARSGIWGELLSTAAMRNGAVGVVTDGAVRDTRAMRDMGFPVFAQFISPYDSYNRQKVCDFDVRVEIGGVHIENGDIIVADGDGVAVVPKNLSDAVLELVLDKLGKEDAFRDAVRNGMALQEAYETYKVL